MAKQSAGQQKTVARVMHAFKQGELEGSDGRTVENPRQAIAIALHEAGASRDEDGPTDARTLRRTKNRERAQRTKQGAKLGATRAELYAEARRRDLPGRSGMTKQQLTVALRH